MVNKPDSNPDLARMLLTSTDRGSQLQEAFRRLEVRTLIKCAGQPANHNVTMAHTLFSMGVHRGN